MAVLAGQDYAAAGRANAIGAKTVVEPHAFLGDAVQVRSLIDAAAVGADGVRRMVVRHDVEYVWPLTRGAESHRACGHETEEMPSVQGMRHTSKAKLSQSDFFRLQALGTFLHNERYTGAFVEGPVAAGCNSRKMDENIFSVFALDKPKTFTCVKPLHCTCFFHVSLSFDLLIDVWREDETAERTFEGHLQTEPSYAQISEIS